jgi:hypothetical protein
MAIYNDIVFGGIPLNVRSLNPVKKQQTRKMVIGKELVETNIIGLSAQQWELNISGHVYGTTTTNLGTNRAALEALDKASSFAYTDNIHDGNYYIKPGSLRFDDSADDVGSYYKYSMQLIEE